MKAKRRVTTSPDVRSGSAKRTPTIRRPKPAIVPAGRPSRVAGPAPAGSMSPAADPPASDPEVDLSVDLGRGLVLASPILVAAGTAGYGLEAGEVVEIRRLGAICTRGTTLRPRPGNRAPRLDETPGGLLNAVGLQNPGIDAVIEKYARLWLTALTPVIVNVAGESVADYVEIARRLEGVPGVAGLELNLSCPNTGRGGLQFGLDAGSAGDVTAAVRRVIDLPLLVKLSPNVTDVRPIARAVADAGADAISAINTVSGLAVDPSRTRPLLGTTYGGLSGPAIRPIALRIVAEVCQVVDVPVIGIGGVTALADVLDFFAVGAVAVQVGTANYADPGLPARLVDELAAACRGRDLGSHRDLVGTARPRRPSAPSAKGVEYRP